MMKSKMTKALANHRVSPRAPLVGKEVRVEISPLGAHAAFEEGAEHRIYVVGMEENLEPLPQTAFPYAGATAQRGGLCFSWTFLAEQEYRLIVVREGGDEKICELPVYALEADLHAMRPYRGDLHVHSFHSDGKEAPAIVAANYRKAGFDFLAITDHRKHAPSLEAIEAYRDAPVDLMLFPGEEVHAPDNHTHIVNFGGSISLNDIYRDDPEGYRAQVDAILEELGETPQGVERREAAASLWAFRKIREGGGLGIFPHPHWNYSVYHIRDAMSRYLFETRAFDAFELLGGQDAFSNNMQTAFYSEMRARGIDVPVVGSSDSHGTVEADLFNWMSTIVFSPSSRWEDIKESILAGRSVAVEDYPGEQPRFYGSYRYVKLAMQLWGSYFVLHDELCFEEGRLMKEYAVGCPDAKEQLARLRGRTGALLAAWYGE